MSEIEYQRILRPHRAMSPRGQQIVLYILLLLLLFLAPPIMISGVWPLLIVLLMPVLWLLMAFHFINYKNRIYEEIHITRDALQLTHVPPNGKVKTFVTDPHWVKIELQKEGGPVEDYLTLRDQKRHVELGRFLSPKERKALYQELLEVKSKL